MKAHLRGLSLLIGLLIPAVQKVREAANRMRCGTLVKPTDCEITPFYA